MTGPGSSGDQHIFGRNRPTYAQLTFAQTLRPFIARFAGATAYFVVLLVIAAVGYHTIEGWNWFDAFYMAVTTVTSVGFMEVHPLSDAGRSFTVFVISLGVTGLGIWWALITALIIELDLGGALRSHRQMKRLENLDDHYVICGGGRVGQMVIREMRRAGVDVVAVEIDPARAVVLEEEDPELLVLCADATRESVLTEARVESARGVAACVADDGANLLVCITARDLNPDVATVARGFDEESTDRLRRAGADHVISPTLTGGIRMASSLLRPHVVSFLDSAVVGVDDMKLRLEEAVVSEGSPLSGKSLAEADIRGRTGLMVIAVRKASGPDGGLIYNPGPETTLGAGDVMIALGEEDQLGRLRRYAEPGS